MWTWELIPPQILAKTRKSIRRLSARGYAVSRSPHIENIYVNVVVVALYLHRSLWPERRPEGHPEKILNGKEASKLEDIGKISAQKIDEFLSDGKIEKLEKYRRGEFD